MRQGHVDGRMPVTDGGDKLWKGTVGVGARHQVNLMGVQEGVLQPSRHAADYAHHDLRAFLLDQAELLDTPPDPLLGIVPDRTGVGQDDIRPGHILGALISGFGHDCEDDLRIVHVHLATICLYIYFSHGLQR